MCGKRIFGSSIETRNFEKYSKEIRPLVPPHLHSDFELADDEKRAKRAQARSLAAKMVWIPVRPIEYRNAV